MNTLIARNRFPTLIIVAVSAVIMLGFARTYYLRVLFDLPPLTRMSHVHGLLATLWLALHFTQARLVATHHVAWHKRLGIFTAAFGYVLAAQSAMLGIAGVAAGHAPPGRDPMEFLSVPMGTTFMFVAFLSAAILLRRRREWHSRLMLLATIGLILPAIGRVMLLFMTPTGIGRVVIPNLVIASFIAWAWVHDWRRGGRVHPALLYGGPLLLLSIHGRFLLGFTDAWQPVAHWLVENVAPLIGS